MKKAIGFAIYISLFNANTSFASTIVDPGSNNYRRWTNNIVPYQFESGIPNQAKKAFELGMLHIRKNSPLRFVLRTGTNANSYPRYIYFSTTLFGCHADSLGAPQSSGARVVNLSANGLGCFTKSTAIHEIMHALGFHHEQKRPDRDNYVIYNQENVDNVDDGNGNLYPGYYQWEIDVNALTYGDYDFRSIMHYGSGQFAKENTSVLETVDPSNFILPSDILTDLDKAGLNHFYPATKVVASLQENPIYVFSGNEAYINGNNSYNPIGGAMSFMWKVDSDSPYFGGTDITLTFLDSGHHTVKLTVSGSGYEDTDSIDINVYGAEILTSTYSYYY